MKRIRVELSNERLITLSGLALVGATLEKSDLVKRSKSMAVEKNVLSSKSRTVISFSRISAWALYSFLN